MLAFVGEKHRPGFCSGLSAYARGAPSEQVCELVALRHGDHVVSVPSADAAELLLILPGPISDTSKPLLPSFRFASRLALNCRLARRNFAGILISLVTA